ncbi:hypothetical protein [Novosphingobium sp.]|uniref:hypothetical protein n=1 Tax=Novosphingobium sp. TaxID=1874826 RepID=UPI0025ED3814|nr:hypothetical protein [Novosphingobium sp.]
MFTQLNPTIPLHVLGKGDGYAIGMIDYGQEHNLIWVTAIDETGEIWCAPNSKVRLGKNWTMGRGESALISQDNVQLREHANGHPVTMNGRQSQAVCDHDQAG